MRQILSHVELGISFQFIGLFYVYRENDAIMETSLPDENKLKRYWSSTTPENVKCEILKRGLHYAIINDVKKYP